MKSMLLFFLFAIILSDVFADTGADIKMSNPIITSGNILDTILRLQKMVTNMSWELKATKFDLKMTKDKLTLALSELPRKDVMNRRVARAKSEVFFQAKQIRYPYRPSKYEPLKFDDVPLNKGGGYNPASGIFTVPRTGIYVCLANVLPDNHNNFGIRLMKEGKTLIRGYSGREGRQSAASIGYLTPFKKGDHVWFDIGEGNSFEIEGGHHSSYGCYLMYE